MTKFTRTAPAAAARKTVRAKVEPITPTTELPQTEQPSDDHDVLSAWSRVQDAVNNMLGTLNKPSWMRQLANMTIGLVVYASTFYGCMALVDMLMMAVMAYTGPGFIAFLVSFFAIFLAFMLSFKVGRVAYEFAASFDYGNVKNRVTSWFSGFGAKREITA